MGGDVRGKAIEGALDKSVMGDSRRSCAKPRKPRCALAVVAKQPVDIGPDHAPIGRYGALGRTAAQAGGTAGAIPAGGYPPEPFLTLARQCRRFGPAQFHTS